MAIRAIVIIIIIIIIIMIIIIIIFHNNNNGDYVSLGRHAWRCQARVTSSASLSHLYSNRIVEYIHQILYMVPSLALRPLLRRTQRHALAVGSAKDVEASSPNNVRVDFSKI